MLLTEGAIFGVRAQGSKRIIILHKCIDRRGGVGQGGAGGGGWDCYKRRRRQWGGRKEYQRGRMSEETGGGGGGYKAGTLGVGWGGGGRIRLGTKD